MSSDLNKPHNTARFLRYLPAVTFLVLAGSLGFGLANRYLPGWFDREAVNPVELSTLQSAKLNTSPAATTGAGWPQWFGPNRDGRAPAGPLRTDWDARPPEQLWSVPCGGGYSSLSVVDGKVYGVDRQGNRERLFCLDGQTGSAHWDVSWEADYGSIGYGSGPRAAPTVYGGKVYFLGATGVLVCIDATAGTILWSHDLKAMFQATAPTWGFASSPLIEGSVVVVQAGGRNGSVVAFNRVTGEFVWAAGSDPNGYSSPVAATAAGVRQIVAITGQSILGIRPTDGEILWRHDWRTRHDANVATPIVVGDYVFASSSYSKGCVLLRLEPSGSEIAPRLVYYLKARVMQNHHSTCVYHDGYLYGYDNDILRCVDLRSGEINEDWIARPVSSGNNKGCVILADQFLIGQTQSGTLFLADADPNEFRLRGKLDKVLAGTDCWALPVLVDGRLYMRDHQKVVCLNVRP